MDATIPDPSGQPSSPGETADPATAIARVAAGERVVVVGADARPLAAVVPLTDLHRLETDDQERARAVA